MTDARRISLVLLAYNQERFVAESVASVLSQDYPNLEIILSDHSSTDATAEVLARLARSYSGPHDVRLNRSSSPGGILGHLLDAAGKTTGKLIVAAAGDDISLPCRVSRLAEAWAATGASIVHSGADAMDERGKPIHHDPAANPYHRVGDYFLEGGVAHIHGATAAYDRAALLDVAKPPFPVFPEDLYLTLMIGLRGGRTAFVPEPLVRYRLHGESHTGAARTADVALQEQASAERSRETALILRHAAASCMHLRAGAASVAAFDLRRLEADARFHEAKADWMRRSLSARILSLLRVRRRGQARWMLPRMFGLGGLSLVRRARQAFIRA